MNEITYAMITANKYYTKEGYEHALRVAEYVTQKEKMDTCVALAIMHDLLTRRWRTLGQGRNAQGNVRCRKNIH